MCLRSVGGACQGPVAFPRQKEASPSTVYGARLLSGFGTQIPSRVQISPPPPTVFDHARAPGSHRGLLASVDYQPLWAAIRALSLSSCSYSSSGAWSPNWAKYSAVTSASAAQASGSNANSLATWSSVRSRPVSYTHL